MFSLRRPPLVRQTVYIYAPSVLYDPGNPLHKVNKN